VAPNQRTQQITNGNDTYGILSIRHTVIGQQVACDRVFDLVFAHVAMHRDETLLITFAGPAVHGKTELAEQVGAMISKESTSVICAELRTSWGLEPGHGGYHDGTKLNHFLADNAGQYSVVFLDEFDKTESKVVEALLTICQTGKW
jgi:ATP-dependent Clp protease ATP-binding subunit ClpA